MQDLNVFLDEPLNPPDFDQNPTLFNIELRCFERVLTSISKPTQWGR